jgi:hypothetical protein
VQIVATSVTAAPASTDAGGAGLELSAHAPPLHTTVVASSVTAAPASADAGGAGLELSSHTPPLHTTVAASAVADAVDTVPPGMKKEFTEDELSYV